MTILIIQQFNQIMPAGVSACSTEGQKIKAEQKAQKKKVLEVVEQDVVALT